MPCIMGTSFVLVALKGLSVCGPRQWVTWSWHVEQTITSHFWREKEPNSFCLTTLLLTHFYLWCKLNLKNQKFLFTFKTFFEQTKRFLSYQICSLTRNLEFIQVWWITKETFLFETKYFFYKYTNKYTKFKVILN